MTKVCLITPPSDFLLDQRVFLSLGILKVGASLRAAGVEVDHMDLTGVSNYLDVVRDYKENAIFAITATTPQMPAAVNIACAIRGKTILGGPHVTLVNAAAKSGNPRAMNALADLKACFDVLVAGDGEQAIFDALIEGRGLIDADDTKSDLWQTSEKFTASPWPDRTLVDMDSYHYMIDGAKATSLISQLGCLGQDTPIVLSSGREVAISAIKAGDNVLCFNEETQQVLPAAVVATHQRQADDIWEIKWGNGEKLLITGEHPIYTREGWEIAEKIQVGRVSAYLRGMQYCISGSIK